MHIFVETDAEKKQNTCLEKKVLLERPDLFLNHQPSKQNLFLMNTRST